jgi:hypothetical protein
MEIVGTEGVVANQLSFVSRQRQQRFPLVRVTIARGEACIVLSKLELNDADIDEVMRLRRQLLQGGSIRTEDSPGSFIASEQP